MEDVLTKEELHKGKRKKREERERESLALPDGRYPSPGSFTEV